MHLQKMILKKKKSYFEEELGKNRNKQKELWKTLLSLSLSSGKARQSKISFKKDSAIQLEALENANTFKRFYSELARVLQEKLTSAPNKFTINQKLLRQKFMQRIQWFWLSTFPEECKIAELKAIFKKGARTDYTNYRSIYLLPLVSNIIEKSIHSQTEDYLNKKKLIYMYQSGFRTNHSTDLCLAQLSDFVATGIYKQMHTSIIFYYYFIIIIILDFQKAFDTLDQDVFLENMKFFGFRTPVIKWFESYFSNRKFLVCIDVFSEGGTLKYGVPLGSIVGLLLFLLYVNDLHQSLSDAGSYLYADDTCIFYQHGDVNEIENVLNKEFSSLCQWVIDNRQSIHFGEDKTKLILFSKTRGLRQINISFAGHSIKQNETVEYLGCQLDSKLIGEAMASKVLKK